MFKFSDYSSVQHARSCRLHHCQNKKGKYKNRGDKKRRATVRYSSCQAGTGSEECVGKNNYFLIWDGGNACVVVWSCCQRVFVHCTIPESMEACFLVVLGGGGGGVLLGRGGGKCCKQAESRSVTKCLTDLFLNIDLLSGSFYTTLVSFVLFRLQDHLSKLKRTVPPCEQALPARATTCWHNGTKIVI